MLPCLLLAAALTVGQKDSAPPGAIRVRFQVRPEEASPDSAGLVSETPPSLNLWPMVPKAENSASLGLQTQPPPPKGGGAPEPQPL